MGDPEGFKNSVAEETADAKIARELGLEVESEEVTELLPSHDQTLTDEELPSWNLLLVKILYNKGLRIWHKLVDKSSSRV